MPSETTHWNLRHQQFPGRPILRVPYWPHVFMALFGAGWAFAFDVGVRLYAAEVIAIAGLATVSWKTAYSRYPMARRVIAAYAVWVFAIALADIVNGTSLFDAARNMANPIIGGLSLLFVLAVISRNPKALLSFFAATALAKGLFGEPAYGDKFSEITLNMTSLTQYADFFKVRVDPFLTPALLLVACRLGRNSLLGAALVLASASVGYMAMNARSSSLVLFLSALALLAIHFRFRPKFGQAMVVGFAALALSYGAYVLYVDYTLHNNSESYDRQQLARLENPYNPVALVLQGRSEWLVMTTAIAERPIIGWGSWAIDEERRFSYLRSERLGSLDYLSIWETNTSSYIPTHSLVGSAWVWSGLLGFAAMAWLLKLIITMATRLPLIQDRKLVPLVVFSTILMVWHYFFSPAQVVRLNFPVSLAALILLTARLNSIGNNIPKRGSL